MPTSRATARTPPDGRRADVSRDSACREIPRAELARARVETRELVVAEAHTDPAVDDADRRRRRACLARRRAPSRSPTSTPSGAGKPCATIVVSRATTARPSSSAARTSSETSMSSFTTRTVSASRPGAGRSGPRPRSARSGPPTIQPAASASPAPVESTASSTGSASRSSPSNEQPRALRLRIHAASTSDRPTRRSSSSLANTTSGADRANRLAERLLAAVADRAPRREVDADAGAVRACELDRTKRRVPHRISP